MKGKAFSSWMMALVASIFSLYLTWSSFLHAQSIRTTDDSIFVEGSSYLLTINRNSGMATLDNLSRKRYTSFPLFALPVPSTVQDEAPVFSWKVSPPIVEMTARDERGAPCLQTKLRFQMNSFEVQFGIFPRIADLGYDVSIINGSWPWRLGLDTSFARNELSLLGQKFQKGLGAHAFSHVTLAFQKPLKYDFFEAVVGLDDETEKKGSVEFQVLADGVKVAPSKQMRGGQEPRLIRAPVRGAKKIELIVQDGDDGIDYDHADWTDARFISSGGNSIYLSDLILAEQEGLKVFFQNGRGIATRGWAKMFTPEPDNFYSNTSVMVGVRQDVDGQRFFAPAPLNLSFQTEAGWFSIGLCELPDATKFRFHNECLSIDYPWSKLGLPGDKLFWITPICFTFNQSEWEAIADYRNYLLHDGYIKDIPIEKKQIPSWWMDPLLCTWGAQCADHAAQASSRFTSSWVKNYVLGQEKALGLKRFSVIIDDKWQRYYGDPSADPVRFKDMRKLVHWIHQRGHKVLLWWRCWYGEKGSLPDQMGLLDGGYTDATHPRFREYVNRAVRIMLGDGKGELDGDGFKVDYIFDVREPGTATYAQPSLGIGIREVFRYASTWYEEAKKVKKDCLITFSGPAPHFSLLQDMSRLNDAGIDRLQRQYRARVSALSSPNLIIDGDGADMFIPLADYHHVVSSAYGTPSLYYLSSFPDGPFTDEMQKVTGQIFRLASLKKPGRAVFKSFGNWQFVRGEDVIAESFQDGTGFFVRADDKRFLVLTTITQDLVVPFAGIGPCTVETEEGGAVDFEVLSGGGVRIPRAQRGKIYVISLKR